MACEDHGQMAGRPGLGLGCAGMWKAWAGRSRLGAELWVGADRTHPLGFI
jgi:hypothetical protein